MTPQEIMIPMRDGVHLQSFVHLPEGEGPFPSLMVRCMYGTNTVLGRMQRFVEEGYAVVAQNVRGRHRSEGGQTGRGDFPEDGFDTMEWMIAQPWCNGRIGTFGGSALARVQAATAFLGHPAHRAMCPQVLPYGMMSRLGGSFMLHQIPMWFFFAQSGPELNPYDQIDWMPHLAKLPATSILDDLGGPLDLFRDIIVAPHENYMNVVDAEQFGTLNTPNLMVSGWYDHCGTGPVDFFLHTMAHLARRNVLAAGTCRRHEVLSAQRGRRPGRVGPRRPYPRTAGERAAGSVHLRSLKPRSHMGWGQLRSGPSTAHATRPPGPAGHDVSKGRLDLLQRTPERTPGGHRYAEAGALCGLVI